jgi:hypothetical protein
METPNSENDLPLTVSHWLACGIGVFGVTVFCFFTILMFYTKQLLPAFFFLVFTVACILLFLANGKTEMDAQTISHRSLMGWYTIAWDKVQHIEIEPSGSSIVFHGQGKQLVIPGKPFWSGKDKKSMVSFLNYQIAQRHINVTHNMWAAYAISKNTRKS